MAHLHRFFIDPETPTEGRIALPPDEAHHARHVVRVQTGDSVVLFDGQGREIEGTVERAGRREVLIAAGRERHVAPSSVQVTLIQAWLHQGKNAEFLIQHGTEIGVDRFCFFRAARSEQSPRFHPRWRRVAIEACKQCGRSRLPGFEVFANLEAALGSTHGKLLLLTQQRAPAPLSQGLAGNSLRLLVGPEGAFTQPELRRAQEHGAHPVSLGIHTYRSEVAALLGAALVLYELGRLGPREEAQLGA